MRLGSRILLGSVAGLAAVSVAHAADFPVKARTAAVQYVKVCSLYGAGFYYIPGTDTCLKIGGYLRTQIETNAGHGGIVTGTGAPGGMTVQGRFDRSETNDLNYRNRAVVTFDTRTQGEYGTLRTYYRVGWAVETPDTSAAGTTANAYWDRAFIQFAGFTVGKAESFFDIFNHGGWGNYINTRTSGDNGASGLMLWAYTAQFGNGFSATISAEDPKGHNLFGVADLSGPFLGAPGTGFTFDNGLADQASNINGFQVPDIIGNLRLDQAWGYVGVSGALHKVAAGYYGTPNALAAGHPDDRWGGAVAIGGRLNVPGLPGDHLGAQFAWSHGAVGYVSGAGTNVMSLYDNSTGVAAVYGADGVFDIGTDIELTDAWNINAAYEHAWTPALKTSLYGGLTSVHYNGTATAMICGTGGFLGTAFGVAATANGTCTPDYSFYQIGSRTQWSPWKGQLNIGLDVVYTHINTAFEGTAAPAAGLRPAGVTLADEGIWSFLFRVQRNWYP